MAVANTSEEMVAGYERFLREQVRARLKDQLMIVAENEVDKVVDLALADFKVTVQSSIDMWSQKLLVDCVAVTTKHQNS